VGHDPRIDMHNTTVEAYARDLADVRTIITRFAARFLAGGYVVVL
jgi:hypothetical protein